MIISLNLLPLAERRPPVEWSRVVVAISVIGTVICSIFYSYGLWQEKILNERLQRANTRYELLRPVEAMMTTARQQQVKSTAKKDILLTLTKERLSWNTVFVNLGTATSSTLWLTDVTGDAKQLVVKGKVAHYTDLSDYMQKIAAMPPFSQPTLIRSEMDKKQGVTGFELSVKIKQ